MSIGRQPPPPGLRPLARREPARSSAIPGSHPTKGHTMAKFKTTIKFCGDRRFDDPVEAVLTAQDEQEARIKALRRYYGNSKICAFIPYNPLPGQSPSGQSGWGYERASRKSGADLASATSMLRVTMERL